MVRLLDGKGRQVKKVGVGRVASRQLSVLEVHGVHLIQAHPTVGQHVHLPPADIQKGSAKGHAEREGARLGWRSHLLRKGRSVHTQKKSEECQAGIQEGVDGIVRGG
jgi:hypothetical protein